MGLSELKKLGIFPNYHCHAKITPINISDIDTYILRTLVSRIFYHLCIFTTDNKNDLTTNDKNQE